MASQTHPHLPSVCPFQAALLDQPQHIVACCISNEGYNQTHLRLKFSVVTGLTAFILARQCGVLMQTSVSFRHITH
jgi:hypothetical protein